MGIERAPLRLERFDLIERTEHTDIADALSEPRAERLLDIPSEQELFDRFVPAPQRLVEVFSEAALAQIPTPGLPSGAKAKVLNFAGGAVGVVELAHARTIWPVSKLFKIHDYYENVTKEVGRSTRPTSVADIQERWIRESVTAAANLCAEANDFTELAREAGIKNTLRLKIIDNTSRFQIFSARAEQNRRMDRAMKEVLDFVRRNWKTVVQCESGIGRTGMVVACIQIAMYGTSVDEAIAYALKIAARQGTVKGIATFVPAQITYIRHFANELAAGRIEGYPVIPRAQAKRIAV